MTNPAALAAALPCGEATADSRGRCSDDATCKNSPDRNADAMNNAAKFFTLRATRSNTTLFGTVVSRLMYWGLSAAERSTRYSKFLESETHFVPARRGSVVISTELSTSTAASLISEFKL